MGGEKSSKYFLNLEKRNHNAKYIQKIIPDKTSEIASPKEVLLEVIRIKTIILLQFFYKAA